MNQTQHALYSKTAQVLEVPKRQILFSNEVRPSTFRKRSLSINRLDGTFSKSEIQTENDSSFFCEVGQAEFWDFLYSDNWNDKGILRVLSGELYTALDSRFKEMLEADEISRHVTFAYLNVKSEEEKQNKLFHPSTETVRVDLTYYNRINAVKYLFRRKSYHQETEIQSPTGFGSDPEFSPDITSLRNLSEEYSKMETKSSLINISEENSKLKTKSSSRNLSEEHSQLTTQSSLRNIFEEHSTLEIKSSLRILSDEHSKLETESSSEKPSNEFPEQATGTIPQISCTLSGTNMFPTLTHAININLEHFPCPMSQDIEDDIVSECSSFENEIQKGNWITKEETWRSGYRATKFKGIVHAARWAFGEKTSLERPPPNNTLKPDMEVSEVDVKASPLMPISIDINLSVLGKIMEREKLLHVETMSSKEREKFFLSDERLAQMQTKMKGVKTKKMPNQTSKIPSRTKEKRKDIRNPQVFATLVLGLTDSPSMYRTLIWLRKPKEKEDKIPEAEISRSKHVGFGGKEEDDKEESSEEILQRRESFKSRNTRSLIRNFTFHPKIFPPQKPTPMINIHRLSTSYSRDYFGKMYHWEKTARSKFHLTKTKITVPNLTPYTLDISSERILKALGDFIVRKERVISSKGAAFISIAFIRPFYLNDKFFKHA